MKQPSTTRLAVLLGLYTLLLLVGVFVGATLFGLPIGLPLIVVSVKKGWRTIKEL
jgi:hypothetical protein